MQGPNLEKHPKKGTAASRRFKRRSHLRGAPTTIEMSQLPQFVAEKRPFILKNRFLSGQRSDHIFVVRRVESGQVWLFWDAKFEGGMWIVADLANAKRSKNPRCLRTHQAACGNLPLDKIVVVGDHIADRAINFGGYTEHQRIFGSNPENKPLHLKFTHDPVKKDESRWSISPRKARRISLNECRSNKFVKGHVSRNDIAQHVQYYMPFSTCRGEVVGQMRHGKYVIHVGRDAPVILAWHDDPKGYRLGTWHVTDSPMMTMKLYLLGYGRRPSRELIDSVNKFFNLAMRGMKGQIVSHSSKEMSRLKWHRHTKEGYLDRGAIPAPVSPR